MNLYKIITRIAPLLIITLVTIPFSSPISNNYQHMIVEASSAPTVTITYPTSGSTLSGSQNRITWKPTSTSGVNKVDIYYSVDGTNFTSIIKNYTGNINSYNWDTTSIPDGSYYLRIDITNRDNPPQSGSSVSSKFSIKNTTTTPSPTIIPTTIVSVAPSLVSSVTPSTSDADKPSVTSSLQPPANDTIVETTPLIKIDYIGGNSPIDIAAVKVTLDGQPITAQVGSQSLFYAPSDPLTQGSHKVEVYLKNTNGLDKTIDWTFSININASPQSTTSAPTKVETVLGLPPLFGIGLIIVMALLILALIIFIILKIIKFIKSKQKPDELSQIASYYAPQNPAPTSDALVQEVPQNGYNQQNYYEPVQEQYTTQPIQQSATPFEPQSQYLGPNDTQQYIAQPVAAQYVDPAPVPQTNIPFDSSSYYSQPLEEVTASSASNTSYYTEPLPATPLPGEAPSENDEIHEASQSPNNSQSANPYTSNNNQAYNQYVVQGSTTNEPIKK